MPETCITFGAYRARVTIEDEEVPHFAMHVNPEKKEVSCWIASEEGKAFSVHWLGIDVAYPSSCSLYLDGQGIGSRSRQSHSAELIKMSNGWVSESSTARFLFSKLVVTDDDSFLDTPPSQSFGEIKLVISRITVPEVVTKHQFTCIVPPQKVHERSKKGIAHQVNFGSEIPTRKTISYSYEVLETLVTFIIKYRPLEMLLANDIVPRNPELLEPQERTLDTPPVSETPSGDSKVKREAESDSEDSESDDEESMREKALLAELEKIRKAKQLKNKRPKKKLKKEEKPIFMPGEIIDLT